MAALLWFAASAAACAQVVGQPIPQSEQPGRERFTEPQAPRAEPAGPRIALPSTVAPEGAERIRLRIRGSASRASPSIGLKTSGRSTRT
jgi:hypothetical protein